MENVSVITSDVIREDRKVYESRNLSGTLMHDVDFRDFSRQVSFFRSEFRNSKFERVKFYKNNFDRADFLDAVFYDCNLERVSFGCCQVKNCYFNNTTFRANMYRNTSIHLSTFENCVFEDEQFLINLHHCEFINCTVKGCAFDMSTTDTNTFTDCRFEETNLATMHSENHEFIKCKFIDVDMDSSYYYGYLMFDCEMQKLSVLYRGDYVERSNFTDDEVYADLKKMHRYFEAANFLIENNLYTEVLKVAEEALAYYGDEKHGRIHHLHYMFNMIRFHTLYENLPFDYAYELLEHLERYPWTSNYTEDEVTQIGADVRMIKEALFIHPHNVPYIEVMDKEKMATLTFRFSSDSLDACMKSVNIIFEELSDPLLWTLVEKTKGSWKLEFSSTLTAVVCIIPQFIKSMADVILEIRMKTAIENKLIENLKAKPLSTAKIAEISGVAANSNLISPTQAYISTDATQDLISITANV